MVTSVSFFYANNTTSDLSPKFSKVTQKENTFPKEDVTDTQLTFKKDYTTTDSVSVIVRVSPTNAKLTKENITLINSQGKEISDVVECAKVEPFTGLLTRSDLNNGLWELTFKMVDGVSAADFKAAVEHNGQSVLFAVAVKNTKLNEDERRVITGYDLTLSAEDAKPASNGFALKDNAGIWRSVEDINNRYGATGAPKEYVWKDATKPATAPITSGSSINVVVGDNRTSQPLLAAEVDKAIEIQVDYDINNNKTNNKIAGFYVTLDSKFASASDPSELNSWNNYSYVGVGVPGDAKRKATLFKGNKGQITVSDLGGVAGDVIGFRLYAVNLDGTLVDPDGRAFYVAVGNTSTEATIPGVTVDLTKGTSSDLVEVEDGTFINCSSVTGWTYASGTKVNNVAPVFTVKYYDADKAEITNPAQYGEIKYVKFVLDNPMAFEDGGTYTQTLELYNVISGTKVLAKTITASVTKKMPTTFKGDFGIKIGQTWNNSSNIVRPFITPAAGWVVGTSFATEGKANLTDIFKGLDGTEKYRFDFGTDDIDDVTSDNGYVLTVPKKLIDDKERAFNVYNIYEDISAKKVNGVWVTGNYEVAYSEALYIKLATWSYGMEYDWLTDKYDYQNPYHKPVLNWTSTGTTKNVALTEITVTNDRDSQNFGGSLASLMDNSGKKNYLNYVAGSAKLTATDGSVNPYFNVSVNESTLKLTFTQNTTDASQAPYGQHEETLTFDVEDAYGIKTTITLPVTVKNPN